MRPAGASRLCDPLNRELADFEVNRDIAGWGVIASFIASSSLCLLASIIYYFLLFEPDGQCHEKPNPVDECVLELRARIFGLTKRQLITPHRKAQLREAFKACILALGDTQILTGACALAAGFSCLDDIPNLYWQVLVNIAWLSHLTHQCVLALLRQDLYKNPRSRACRVFLMTILFVFLLVATVPTLYFDWRYELGRPFTYKAARIRPPVRMSCFYHFETLKYIHKTLYDGPASDEDEGPFSNGLFALAFLTISYSTRVVKLYRTSSDFFRKRLRCRAGRIVRGAMCLFVRALDMVTFRLIGPAPWFFLVECTFVGLYTNCQIAFDLYASVLSDIASLCFGFLLVINRIMSVKLAERLYLRDGNTYDPSTENSTGFGHMFSGMSRDIVDDQNPDTVLDFGQLLPLALLVAPIFSIVQCFTQKPCLEPIISPLSAGIHMNLRDSSVNNHEDKANEEWSSLRALRLRKDWRLKYLLELKGCWKRRWLPNVVLASCSGAFVLLGQLYRTLTAKSTGKMSTALMCLLFNMILTVMASGAPAYVCAVLTGWRRQHIAWLCWIYTTLAVAVNVSDLHLIQFDYEQGDYMIKWWPLWIINCVLVGGCWLICLVACIWPGQ